MPDSTNSDLRQQPDVQRALADLNQPAAPRRVFRRGDRAALLTYGLLIGGVLILFYLHTARLLVWPVTYETIIRKTLRAVGLVGGVLIAQQLIRVLIRAQVENVATQYNLRRVVRLAMSVLIGLIVITSVFTNWYTTLLSLGVVSLILGIALQNPIASFFAWVYILLRRPYSVGDRVKIGNATGDVIDVGYFDTTLWEFNGDYLSGDHPSGRVIRFANLKVFSEYIFNYSWPLFPYIWNELKFYVAYESDLDFVSETARQVVQTEIGEQMQERVAQFRELLCETPVDQLTVNDAPSVMMRAHENTWIEVIVRYLVEPRESGRVRNRLFSQVMRSLRQEPDRVLFPKSNNR